MNRRFFLRSTATAAAIAASAQQLAESAALAPSLMTNDDAELVRLGADFDRIINKGGAWEQSEVAADRIMAVAPATMAGLALWARVMLWRFDPRLRAIAAEPSPELAEYGVNEAYALAAAIERMACHTAGLAS